ncbi:MAG: heterodisulfide reductase subunit A [Deltaproteobacteria bacterium]|nr:MAG: heterodisulfide reductase subunit A [Deltaproteobacteria bacterium]
MAEKIGCFVCTGCTIGEAMDCDKLVAVAGEMQAAVVEQHPALCQPEGVEMLRRAIAEHELDAVVVAACSARVHGDTFDFEDVYTERASLREGVAWTQPAGEEDTQMLAEDVVRMGIGRCRFAARPTGTPAPVQDRVLVIGGGVTGLSAALAAAAAGKQVDLVEREQQLGGFANKLHKIFPRDAEVAAYPGPDVDSLLARVAEHDNITVHLGATVTRISGAPGAFEVTVGGDGGEQSLASDAVVVAAGWQPYDAAKIEHLGYGRGPDVITNVEFEQLAKQGKIARPSDGKVPESVLFVQCAGSRDPQHLPYCSNLCCPATLKHITYLKEQSPETVCYVLYKDIRAPGHYEQIFEQVQRQGAIFVKADVERVEPQQAGGASVSAQDLLLGEPLQVEVDLVVLAIGMVPVTLDSDVLNLTYRQGPELPEREGGFPNSHFICFPYETQRTAIYAAGAVRTPMDLATCVDDGTGAAAKALQAIEFMRQGAACHPRVGDLSLPDFHLQRCTQCKRCTEECPFGALDEDAKGTPQPNPTRCRRCGVCMGACPERIVSFENYSVQMISEGIKSIFVPDEFEEKPRVLAFACENDAMAALDMAAMNGLQLNPYVRVIPVRCLGSFNIIWVADALSRGIDGIMLMGCRFGDDYQCHFIKGSELANTRLKNVGDTLDRLMLESERLRLEQVAINDWRRLPQMFDDFLARLDELGPNPYKE